MVKELRLGLLVITLVGLSSVAAKEGAEEKDNTTTTGTGVEAKPGPPPSESIDALLVALGDDEFAVREEAQGKLMRLDVSFAPKLQQAMEGSRDPEVSKRLNHVVTELLRRATWATLNAEERALVKMGFGTAVSGNPQLKCANGRVYAAGSYGICDIGNQRLAIKGLNVKEAQHFNNLYINPPSGFSSVTRSAVGGQMFESEVANRRTSCKWADISFELRDDALVIDGRSFPFNEVGRLILLSKDGKVLKAVDIQEPRVDDRK